MPFFLVNALIGFVLDLPLHSMRDHPAHVAPLVGASWGTHLNRRGARGKWKKAWDKMLQDENAWAERSSKGPDQILLKVKIISSLPVFLRRAPFSTSSYIPGLGVAHVLSQASAPT